MWGISSVILAVFFAFVSFAVLGSIILLEEINPAIAERIDDAACLAFFASYSMQIVALACGIIGVYQTNTNKTFAICGIAISAVLLVMIVGIIVLGMILMIFE